MQEKLVFPLDKYKKIWYTENTDRRTTEATTGAAERKPQQAHGVRSEGWNRKHNTTKEDANMKVYQGKEHFVQEMNVCGMKRYGVFEEGHMGMLFVSPELDEAIRFVQELETA